jgi:glycosyltransferase involved in cell wall biosynthesis
MELTKSKILIFIDWFLPGYKAGGPIKSVKNIVSVLSSEYDFWIVTGDRDLGDTSSYSNILLNLWQQQNNYRIIYLTPDKQNYSVYKQLIVEISPEQIYFNSLFSFRFTILPLLILKLSQLAVKTIIAPRGMLGTGALQINKIKKQFFLVLCKLSGFFKHTVWHASSINEELEIKNHIGQKVQIKIAINLSDSISETWKPKKKQKGEVCLFFVSRISEKKNLLFALECLSEIKKVNLIFFLIGTMEDTGYWERCEQYIFQLPKNIKVEYAGHIENSQLHNRIKDYHFLLFPTLHENFGHVIAESIQAGCPVIISDQTPWRNLEAEGIGWDIPLDNKQKFVQVIRQCAEMNQDEYNRMSNKAFEYAQKVVNNPEIVEQNRQLFRTKANSNLEADTIYRSNSAKAIRKRIIED